MSLRCGGNDLKRLIHRTVRVPVISQQGAPSQDCKGRNGQLEEMGADLTIQPASLGKHKKPPTSRIDEAIHTTGRGQAITLRTQPLRG